MDEWKSSMNNKYMWSILFIAFVLQFMLFACGSSGDGNNTSLDPLPSNEGNTIIDCSVDNPDPACGEDKDNDGLTYAQETLGWDVVVDTSGFGAHEHYSVTSDPDIVDSDDDGMSDLEEFLNKTDPTMKDTDGDGLSDIRELTVWHTSPLSVDSDGDSRGPDKDLPPNSSFFDGAELKIDMNDETNQIPGHGATSPVTEDTDGDGWTDYHEIVDSPGQGFDPVIADVPSIAIDIALSPKIGLTGSSATQSSWTKDISVSDTLSQSVSTERGISQGTEYVTEHTVGAGLDLGFEVGYEKGWVGKVSTNASINYSYTASNATSQSISWTSATAREAETTYQEAMAEGGSEEITLDGGYITVDVNLINTGNIAYTLTNLRLNVLARYINGDLGFTPVLELGRKDDLPLTLAPGASVFNILMEGETSDYELILDLLKNPSGLLIEVASYTLADINGNSYDFFRETINQKTAMVIIDYGGELPPESFMVATAPSRDTTLSHGATVKTVFSNILDIPYETDQLPDTDRKFLTLSSVRSVANDSKTNKKWLVSTSSASIDKPGLQSVEDIVLLPGDTLYLAFVKDQDGDGLAAREERLQGTSDLLADSDGDGLTDFDEIRGGWKVKVEGQVAYDVMSRGSLADSDEDGLSDSFEAIWGLDPGRKDTDQDGIDDYSEIYGYNIMNGDTLFLHVRPYSGTVILDGGNATIDTTELAGDDLWGAVEPIDAGDILISAGENGVLDTAPSGDDYSGVVHTIPAAYATDPLNMDTDNDGFTDGLEKKHALGSPNNPEDFSLYADSDDDGLSDAVEEAGYSIRINGSIRKVTSNPNDGDSDHDGLPDLLEYHLKSDPNNVDTDGDTLLDYNEYDFVYMKDTFVTACGTHTGCQISTAPGTSYGTALNDKDTDGDGLNDNIEIQGWKVSVDGGIPQLINPLTNPISKVDTDGDGLYDGDEFTNKTDPNKWDTDGDKRSDKEELIYYPEYGRRSPIYKDKVVKVTYYSLSYNGYCDEPGNLVDLKWWMGLVLPNGDFNPMLKSRVLPGVILNDNLDTGIVSKSVPFYKIFSKSKSFVIKESKDEHFQLFGYIKEKDGKHSDGGMMFYDVSCLDCKDHLTIDPGDNLGNMVHVTTTPLAFDGLINSDQTIRLVAGQRCWTYDNQMCIFPLCVAWFDFQVILEAKVEVQE